MPTNASNITASPFVKLDEIHSLQTPRILIFGYGNIGRGDDGLGVELIEKINALNLTNVTCLTDMQLQVEHITDLLECDIALFVDADVSCDPPFVFEPLKPSHDASYTSHAMSPAALLHSYQMVYKTSPPPCYLLRIRGYQFELGMPLSAMAEDHLSAAYKFTTQVCHDIIFHFNGAQL